MSTATKAAANIAKAVAASVNKAAAVVKTTATTVAKTASTVAKTASKKSSKDTKAAVSKAVAAASQVAQAVQTQAAQTQAAVSQAAQAAGEAAQNAINEAEAVKAAVAKATQAAWNMAAEIAEKISGTVDSVKNETGVDISEFFGYGWADFGAHGSGSVWDDILDWLTSFIVQPLLLWVADLINGLIILTSSFRRFSYSVWSFLGRVTDKFIDTVSVAWSNAWEMVVDTSKVIYDYIASQIFEIGQIIDTKIEEARGWIEDVKAEVKEWFMTAYHILTDPYIHIWLWLKNNWPSVYNLLSDPVEFIKIALENFKYFITAIIFTPLLELIDNLWGD